jgi:hypothetical protein
MICNVNKFQKESNKGSVLESGNMSQDILDATGHLNRGTSYLLMQASQKLFQLFLLRSDK